MMSVKTKIAYILGFPVSRRQKLAMRERSGASLKEFRSAFPEAEKEAEELWKGLQSVAITEGFCPAPEDDLLRMHGLADEDLDDVILDALGRLGYRVPEPDESIAMGPVRTVRDAVRFLKAWGGVATSPTQPPTINTISPSS